MSLAIKKQKKILGAKYIKPGEEGYSGIKEAGKILERVKNRDFYRYIA